VATLKRRDRKREALEEFGKAAVVTRGFLLDHNLLSLLFSLILQLKCSVTPARGHQ